MYRHQENGSEPLVKREFGVLENRALEDGERRATFTAFEPSITTAVRVHTAAIRASNKSIGVDLFLNELIASGVVTEMAEDLRKRVEMGKVYHGNSGWLHYLIVHNIHFFNLKNQFFR